MALATEKVAPDLTLTHVEGNGEIITYSGNWFNVLDPDPKDVFIEDIAHSLANQCRFTGHVREFYSTAQHSWMVSIHCAPEDALWGLLHDASEAYLSDIARPVKKHPDFGPFYIAAEEKLMKAVCEAFGLPAEMPASVHEADNILLRTEARDLMPDTFPVYEGPTLWETIYGWAPEYAEENFLRRFKELSDRA